MMTIIDDQYAPEPFRVPNDFNVYNNSHLLSFSFNVGIEIATFSCENLTYDIQLEGILLINTHRTSEYKQYYGRRGACLD